VALLAPRKAMPAAQSVDSFPLSLALVFVLFTYGGWNEMAYVAAEVKDFRRNIVRALVLGAAVVTVLYLLVNGAFLYTLGYAGLATSKAVASDAISTTFPRIGGGLISALVCISALGAVSGLIFTGARISYALGAEHRAFRSVGKWHARTGTPAWALLVQGVIAVGLIVVLGSFVDTILYTAAPVYAFYLATSLAVIVLRFKEPDVERPYRVTGYPFTTLIFSAVCAFLIYSTVSYAWNVKTKSLCLLEAILLAGMLIYCATDVRDLVRRRGNGNV
jgi:amino acid transporter